MSVTDLPPPTAQRRLNTDIATSASSLDDRVQSMTLEAKRHDKPMVRALRKFLATKPAPIAGGSYKTVYATKINGQQIAVAVTTGGSLCSDPAILKLAQYKKEQDASRESFYVMPKQYMVDDDLVGVAPLMRGQGTDYVGEDGFNVLFGDPVSVTHPYSNPAQNFMRHVLNFLLGPLQMYEDAKAIGCPRIVHGDLKAEQNLVGTREKEGLARPYAALKLADMPDKVDPKEKTPGFCNPAKFKFSKRFHSDDLYAIKATLAKTLYRLLTTPLYDGSPANPLGMNKQEGNELLRSLIRQENPRVMSKEEIASYCARGYPLLTTLNNITHVYPDILTPGRSSSTLEMLQAQIENSAKRNAKMCKSSQEYRVSTTVHALAIDLIHYLNAVGDQLEHTLACEDQGASAEHTQQSVIDILRAMDDDIRTRYFPRSGVTASPFKAVPYHAMSQETQEIEGRWPSISESRTRLFGA